MWVHCPTSPCNFFHLDALPARAKGNSPPPAPPPLTLPASITVSPLATSPTRCAHPSTAASPRPPIQLRLIFFSSFDLIATHRSRRKRGREGSLGRRSAGWWRRFVDLRAPGFLDLRRYVLLSRSDRISGPANSCFSDLGPGWGVLIQFST